VVSSFVDILSNRDLLPLTKFFGQGVSLKKKIPGFSDPLVDEKKKEKMSTTHYPLPYKLVIFKAIQNDLWRQATMKTFDIATDPFERSNGMHSLKGFRLVALDLLMDYLAELNRKERKPGCTWYLKSIQAEGDTDLPKKYFSAVFAIAHNETAFRNTIGLARAEEEMLPGTPMSDATFVVDDT
jgi:hypothetical protein